MSVNGAELLFAAIKPAIHAGAPRRTIHAVACGVAGVILRPEAKRTVPPVRRAETTEHDAVGVSGDPAVLLESLRNVRRMQRLRKKERRRAAKLAARGVPSNDNDVSSNIPDGAAGGHTDDRGSSVVELARAPVAPADDVPLNINAGAPISQPIGGAADHDNDAAGSMDSYPPTLSIVTGTDRGQETASAGSLRQSPYADAPRNRTDSMGAGKSSRRGGGKR